jgi:ubiquinone biosynthesis protein COQ9
MIVPPERSQERDAAVDALTPLVATLGWNTAALQAALQNIGGDPLDAELLFPGGAADMIEAFIDLADRRMEAAAAAQDLAALRLPARVRALVAIRLEQSRPHKGAVRRALAVLSLPRHAGLATRCTARTLDAIWHGAQDRSADFSWYTKRVILAAVYTTTILFWLRDDGEDNSATLAFLDRRLASVGRIGSVRRRLAAMLPGCGSGQAQAA